MAPPVARRPLCAPALRKRHMPRLALTQHLKPQRASHRQRFHKPHLDLVTKPVGAPMPVADERMLILVDIEKLMTSAEMGLVEQAL